MEDLIDLSDETFEKLSRFLFERSGITIKKHKKYLIQNRLSKFIGPDKEFKTYEEYYEALKKGNNELLIVNFVNVLTTNYSFFFREDIHFEFYKKILPDIVNKEAYVRVWSAACSTGEEPYSIAISSYQVVPNIDKKDFKILATDISTRVLDVAEEGAYVYNKIEGHVPEEDIKKYFINNTEKRVYIAKEDLKKLIAFRYLNLLEDFPFKKKFDIVFLRNVLIYFDNKEKEYIINKIYEYIKSGGYLILGLSESLVGIKHRLTALKNSIFLKKE